MHAVSTSQIWKSVEADGWAVVQPDSYEPRSFGKEMPL